MFEINLAWFRRRLGMHIVRQPATAYHYVVDGKVVNRGGLVSVARLQMVDNRLDIERSRRRVAPQPGIEADNLGIGEYQAPVHKQFAHTQSGSKARYFQCSVARSYSHAYSVECHLVERPYFGSLDIHRHTKQRGQLLLAALGYSTLHPGQRQYCIHDRWNHQCEQHQRHQYRT